MPFLVSSNTKEEINKVLRLIQAGTTGGAATAATPSTLGLGAAISPPSGTPGYNLTPIKIYPLKCDSTGNLVTDSEGFLSTDPVVVAVFP